MSNYTFLSETTENLEMLDTVFNTAAPSAPINDEISTSNVLKDGSVEKMLDNKSTATAVAETPVEITEPATERQVENALDNISKTVDPAPVAEGAQPVVEEPATGRPKTDRNALVEYMLPKITSQEFGVPDDYDTATSIEDYLNKKPLKDLYSILDSNRQAEIEEIRKSAPTEFYDALPDPVKDVAEYAANGGQDWQGFFASKLRTQQIQTLDPNNEDHIPLIVETYLAETTQLTPAQRNEQIGDWKEAGKLEAKAKEFKVPLDQVQQQRTQQYQQQAQAVRQEELRIAEYYADNVYKQLSKNELAGMKLDKNTVSELQNGLLSTVRGPFSGKPMNILGALIEQKSYIEPDYEAIMLATMILQNKEEALKRIGQRQYNEGTNNSVKLIKIAQGLKTDTGVPQERQESQVRRLPNNNNVLKRKSV